MTMKQFVKAVHEAWNNDFFLSATDIHSIRCRMHGGVLYFYAKLVDKSTISIHTTEEGKIVFF